jgi:hypothetical protein
MQIGGDHYKAHGKPDLQHWDMVAMLKLDYFAASATKYLFRWKNKNGVQDLQKCRHYIAKRMELRMCYGYGALLGPVVATVSVSDFNELCRVFKLDRFQNDIFYALLYVGNHLALEITDRYIEDAQMQKERSASQNADDISRFEDDLVEQKAASTARFVKVSSAGRALPKSAQDWACVYDAESKLYWTRKVLPCGAVPWQRAMDECLDLDLLNAADWRAPTICEQLSIIDYERSEPALDTEYFDGEHGWTWTSTPAKALSGCAWSVALPNGTSYRFPQSYGYLVRAVRAGQTLDLGL